MVRPFITRFAPSPTGPLHLGHAYAAKVAYELACKSNGKMILRIDDIDHTRCQEKFIQPIFTDLEWLGFTWHGSKSVKNSAAPRQSNRHSYYQEAFATLKNLDLVYPCYLSRRELNKLLSAPHTPLSELSHTQQIKKHITNTDQLLAQDEKERRRANGHCAAWRLRMESAIKLVQRDKSDPLSWFDYITGHQTADPTIFGDIVIARADIAVSYHLSVVVDDAIDGVTLVTRGKDLAPSTHVHRLLQALLNLPVPDYCHHPLVLDQSGNRLAKRNSSLSLSELKKMNANPLGIFAKMPPIPQFQTL